MNNFGEQTGEIYATRDFREIGVGKLGTDQINGVGIDTDFGGPCNQSCVQCYKALTHTGRKELIPMDHFRRILDEAKDVDGHEIYLLGTDTLMHPKIAQMTRESTERDFFTLLVTNGLLFGQNEELCRTIADTGAGLVQQFRVIGTDKETADALVYVQGIPRERAQRHLETVNRGIERLLHYFPHDRIVAQSCLNRRLVETEQVFKVYDFCLSQGLKPVMELIKPTSGVFERGHQDDLSLEEVGDVFQRLGEIRQNYRLNQVKMNSPSYGNFCHMFRTGVHIGGPQFNDVYACDGQTSFVLGHIGDQKLRDIITSDRRRNFLQAKDERVGHCLDCKLYGDSGGSCDAGCNGANLNDTGCFKASSTYCPQILERGVELKYENFVPETCDECSMQPYGICQPKKEIPIYLKRGELVLISKEGARTINLGD